MAIDFEILKAHARKAEREAPFEILPALPVIDIKEGEDFSISISPPRNEGAEFTHWRLLYDLDFIRVRHEGHSGFGAVNNRVEGLTAIGEEFVELSRDDQTWTAVINRCKAASACTMDIVLRELKKEARSRIDRKKVD